MRETKPRDPDEHYDRREKGADERFCHSCGAVVKKSSAICPKCGVSITGEYGRKDKSTAILLAIFTSFFSWLYLYEKNTVKFWLGLGATAASAIIATTLFDSSNQYWYCGIIPAAIVWMFAVVDVSTKGASYYESFGG